MRMRGQQSSLACCSFWQMKMMNLNVKTTTTTKSDCKTTGAGTKATPGGGRLQGAHCGSEHDFRPTAGDHQHQLPDSILATKAEANFVNIDREEPRHRRQASAPIHGAGYRVLWLQARKEVGRQEWVPGQGLGVRGAAPWAAGSQWTPGCKSRGGGLLCFLFKYICHLSKNYEC